MRILACVDGSEPAKKAVGIAAQLADVSGARMTLLHVIESEVSRKEPVFDDYGENFKKARSFVRDAENIVAGISNTIAVESQIAVGPVSSEIVKIAEEGGYGAIFIGTTGSNRLVRMLIGSVADDVIHYAHCPVTVVR